MELSTDLLANVTFREQWRGYSPDQVDEFLERLGVAIAELKERVAAAERKAVEAEAANDQDEIMRTLVLAQRTASAAVDEARQDAARIVAEAEAAKADRIREADEAAEGRLVESEATAEARLADVESSTSARIAEVEASTSARIAEVEEAATARLADAEATAAAMLTAAEVRLAELEEEIARREREELAGLEVRRDELVGQIEAMEAYQDDGRARLRSELEAQLGALDAGAQGMPPWIADLAVARRAAAPATVDPVEDEPAPVAATEPDGADTQVETVADADEGPRGEPAPRLFDRAVEDPSGDLPYLGAAAAGPSDEELVEAGRSDPVLTRARAELADALREAGVLLESGNGATSAGPGDRRVGDDTVIDVSMADTGETEAINLAATRDEGEAGAADPTGGDEGHGRPDPGSAEPTQATADDEPSRPQQMDWRSVSIPDEPEDDPFLAELRRAVTDTEPLGPRDLEPTQEHPAFDDQPDESRFRLRRNRG